MEGYIKLARCLLRKPMFKNEKLLKVWIWCLLKATHTEHEQLVGLQKVPLLPGQFITGRYAGAKELNMNPSTFWKYLLWLKNNESLDIKGNSKYSLVTVVNWESYQLEQKNNDNKNDNKITAKEQQRDTNKNGKNDKNKYTSSFDEFWSSYPKKKSKQDAVKAWNKIKPDDELFNKIIKALEQHKKDEDWTKQNGQFIPHPATWLNGRRWEDEVTVSQSEVKDEEWGY